VLAAECLKLQTEHVCLDLYVACSTQLPTHTQFVAFTHSAFNTDSQFVASSTVCHKLRMCAKSWVCGATNWVCVCVKSWVCEATNWVCVLKAECVKLQTEYVCWKLSVWSYKLNVRVCECVKSWMCEATNWVCVLKAECLELRTEHVC